MMKKSTLFSTFFGALFIAGLAIAPAHAQATRTWISGVGDDVNPCSRTAPCKTWPGAISKTATGGEIDALDPGGFGAVTITKSITLDGGGGQVASILVSGTNGVNVSAGATGVVILRNLRLNGILNSGSPGLTAVAVNSAATVIIEKCDIFGFSSAGVTVLPSSGTVQVKIQETNINNSGIGLSAKPTGGATVNVSIDHSFIDSNTGGGLKIDGTGGGPVNVAINDSSVSLNASNGTNAVSGPSGSVTMDLTRVTLAKNGGAAVQANISGGGTSMVTVGELMLSNNGSAWQALNGASLLSYKNNQVTGPVGTGPSGQANFQ